MVVCVIILPCYTKKRKQGKFGWRSNKYVLSSWFIELSICCCSQAIYNSGKVFLFRLFFIFCGWKKILIKFSHFLIRQRFFFLFCGTYFWHSLDSSSFKIKYSRVLRLVLPRNYILFLIKLFPHKLLPLSHTFRLYAFVTVY